MQFKMYGEKTKIPWEKCQEPGGEEQSWFDERKLEQESNGWVNHMHDSNEEQSTNEERFSGKVK